MTQEEVLKEAKIKYFPDVVIRSVFSGNTFTLYEGFVFGFDHDGDLRARNCDGTPVLWEKATNKWALIISSPKPIINNQIIDNYEIY